MNRFKYKLVFAFCQYQTWTICDIKNKKYLQLAAHELRDWHGENNIYLVYRQSKHILSVGNYFYYDLYDGVPIEKLQVAYNCSFIDAMVKYFLEVRQEDFNVNLQIRQRFGLSLKSICKTKAKLAEEILFKNNNTRQDKKPLDLRISKYKNIAKEIGSGTFTERVAGIDCRFGFGGIHGAREQYIGEGEFVNLDVVSMYPSIMINYNLMPKCADVEKYKQIYSEKIRNPSQPLKVLLNATFGATRERFNKLYDPEKFNEITKYGQLLMLDLIEHIDNMNLTIIQTNTDSILVKMPSNWAYDGVDEFYKCLGAICKEWQMRTGLRLDYGYFRFVAQKDVNNYVAKTYDGKVITKGAYVKEQMTHEVFAQIINYAVRQNLLYNESIESSILTSNFGFEMISSISDKYTGLYLGGKPIGKSARIYATKFGEKLTKKNAKTGKFEKVAGTPDRCSACGEIDKNWYVEQAHKRVRDFGRS